jgi:hypothetical protein
MDELLLPLCVFFGKELVIRNKKRSLRHSAFPMHFLVFVVISINFV